MSIGSAYFQERASIDPESECLLWLGRMSAKEGRSDSQAVMKVKSKNNWTWLSVARYTWELVRTPLEPTTRLRKVCENPLCVLPDHFVEMTKFCPAGHRRTEKTIYVATARWTNAKGEPKTSPALHCRICSVESDRKIRLRKKLNSANLVE